MAGIVRQLVVIAVLAGAAAGGWRLWSSHAGEAAEQVRRERPAPGVEAARVAREAVETTVAAVGVARPVRSVALATLSEGRVETLGFDSGERVVAGQVLLRLEDTVERATLREAEASLERARAAYDRAETLKAQRRIPESDFDTARAEFGRAAAVVERARKLLADRTLVAPFDGVAGFRTVDVGAVVRANTVVADLVDAGALNVDFAVPERFYGQVAVGAPIRAATEVFPGEAFDGALTAVDARIDTVTRSFTARARIDNAALRLPADAFMRVTLVLDARDSVMAPEEAVVSEGGETVVYVVAGRDGDLAASPRAERRAVAIGARHAGRAEILDGLEAGEVVITRGVQKVADGRPVRVLNADALAPAVAAAPGA